MNAYNKSLAKIKRELQNHNDAIGAPPREPEKLTSDAKFVRMIREDGITVETLAMITTDFEFALRKASKQRANKQREDLIAALKHLIDADPCRLDHHGMCQTHFLTDGKGNCAVRVVRELIAKVEGTP